MVELLRCRLHKQNAMSRLFCMLPQKDLNQKTCLPPLMPTLENCFASVITGETITELSSALNYHKNGMLLRCSLSSQ